jgi:hypothetical protein
MKVTLGEKEITLAFTMMAVEEISNRQAKGSSGWVKMITDIVWGGYVAECFLSDSVRELSYREIATLVDDALESDVLPEVFNAFLESKGGKKLFDQAIEEVLETEAKKKPKKKPTGTKSKGLPLVS